MKDIFLLDMDDTLLDFARAERENLKKTLGGFGIEADEELVARFHAINDALWKALERGETTREELLVRRFVTLFEEYGSCADAELASKVYFENFPGICFPFAGAAEFLAALSARGRVYLCTNGSTVIQRRHIELAGFAPFLSGVFISQEVGFDKPSKEYAEAVMAAIPAFRAENTVWIGDSLTSDCLCAKRMGTDFILFLPRGEEKEYSGKRVSRYEEVFSLL